MKDLVLIQKQGFTKYEFILKDDCISVREFSIKGNKQWTVPLEGLGHKTVIEKDSSLLGKGLSLFFGLFTLIFIVGNAADHSKHIKTWLWIAISMFYALASIFIFTAPVTNEIRIVGGHDTLVMLSDKPSEIQVRKFVEEVIKRSKEVLLRKYVVIDPDLPEEAMISQLNWLMESEVISQEVFDKLKAEYYQLKSKSY